MQDTIMRWSLKPVGTHQPDTYSVRSMYVHVTEMSRKSVASNPIQVHVTIRCCGNPLYSMNHLCLQTPGFRPQISVYVVFIS